MESLTSVPGIGLDLAIKILAEIGEIDRFPSPKHLASYAGLAPAAKNLGGRRRAGKPTKKSNGNLRRYMFLAALAAVRTKNSVVSGWFRRSVVRSKHFKVAVVAVARKLLVIIWHLLMKGKTWFEVGFAKRLRGVPRVRRVKMSLKRALEVLERAGYVVVIKSLEG